MANKSSSGCFGCIFGIIIAIVIIVLIAGFFLSKYITCDRIGIADKEGILHRFNEDFPQEATLRTEGMENWKVYDFIMWIVKSGDYKPA